MNDHAERLRLAARMAHIEPFEVMEIQTLAREIEARVKADRDAGRDDPKLEEFRWLIEELRVSLFAQELRTPFPVSAKRLQKFWDENLR